MNGRRKSPRLNKIKERSDILSPLSTDEPTSSQSLVAPASDRNSSKTSKDRVNLLKKLKKISDKSQKAASSEQLTSRMTKNFMKNRGKIPKNRKNAKKPSMSNDSQKKSKSKAKKPSKKVHPKINRLPKRRSERISNRVNLTPSTSSSSLLWSSNQSSASTSLMSSPNQNIPNLSSTDVTNTLVSSIMNSPTFIAPDIHSPATTSLILSESCVSYLKTQLKKATIKFDKACRQLNMLDQQMNDLQNSYSNSLENDRKTFKIIYRMQLATYEGAHNAYIQYIERQVEKIKKLKRLLFNDASTSVDLASPDSNTEFALNQTN